MNNIGIIARRELASYLRSPLSWVIAAVLLLAQGIFFQAWALRGEQWSGVVLERFFFISSFVIGTARPLHVGRRSHVWEIRITDEQERLVCVSRITMYILDRDPAK